MDNMLAKWAKDAFQIAQVAGDKILAFYDQKPQDITEYKADNSPLTLADKASHQWIVEALSDYPLQDGKPVPILSEEGKHPDFLERQGWPRYWCVDPLDGTREFLAKNGEFTVNIALIENHEPVLGVIYVPAQQKGYLAWRGGGAYSGAKLDALTRITTTKIGSPIRILVSRHCQEQSLYPWTAALGDTTLLFQGSALKFCTLAEGKADIFVRMTPTSEWDNAAGHCLVEAAGGKVFTLHHEPLSYNRSGALAQANFIAVGDSGLNWQQFIPAGF